MWRTWMLGIAAVAVTAKSEADLLITMNPVTVRQGETGRFFDVFVTGTNIPETLKSYNITLNAVRLDDPLTVADESLLPTGLTFTTATPNPTGVPADGYVFAPPTGDGAITVAADPFPDRIVYSDSALGLLSTPIAVGQTFGLGRVFFDIANNAFPGLLRIDVDPLTTSFVDANPADPVIPFDFAPGQVTLLAAPEPSSMALLALSGVIGGGMAWRRRRAEKSAAAD